MKKTKLKTGSKNADLLDVTLAESRKFAPSKDFARKAIVQTKDYSRLKKKNHTAYWVEAARDLDWFKPWKKPLIWKSPNSQWFVGGKLNASYNCLDRHAQTQPNKAAVIWEGEPGDTSVWTYSMLQAEVEKLTAALRKLGMKSGDRVAIYMPLVPEAVVAMLACARGGFTHTVVFGGFSAEALKDRIQDAEANLVLTCDGGYRKEAWVALKEQTDIAIAQCPTVKHRVILKRKDCGKTTNYIPGSLKSTATGSVNDYDWSELLSSVSTTDQKKLGAAEVLDSEHPLFILYTSGTTGKPKGIVHSTGGYLTGALRTTRTVFDLQPTDVYWCTADIGWVTGHSYVVYGPLALGATVFIYEGALTTPAPDRIWALIEKYRVSILYTAPTAIRALMRLGDQHPKSRDLTSLRLLGTVGEPINPEAWMWYRDVIGGSRCPIVDTYWQTETGAIVISPLPGVTTTKPGSATLPLPGYDVEVVDKKGKPVPVGSGGYLVIRKPWPSMARTIHKDPERFKKQYFSEFPGGIYFTGDGARKDRDGYIWCLGRVDDVLNVSGHRLGTMEIESVLVAHPSVAEAAVVGRPDDLKGQAVVAFVTLKMDAAKKIGKDSDRLGEMGIQLKAFVSKEIGAIARPEELRFTDSLPKTRSGKIMRRLLRELASTGKVNGDTTTLEDFNVLASLQMDQE